MQQTTAEQPKTRHLSHKFTPVFATQKLAGFAEFTQICGTTPTRNRDTRYRYIGDEPLVLLENAGSAGGNTGANASTSANGAKTRSRPNSEYVLYSNGEPVAVNADGDTSYFGTDILGSVRSVTDKYGQVTADYSYDAFGTPYLSNDFDSGAGFGYTGKVYDSATGLYDYGFRDYSPNSARFTTIDPVRDGNNWFSYCMNDAVNYVDLWGLSPISDLIDGAKEYLKHSPGEITNETEDYMLFPRAEENTDNEALKQIKETFAIEPGKTLTETLTENGMSDKMALDVLVLPDRSAFKGWSGSKITIIQKQNGSLKVKQTFGTFAMNTLGNIGKFLSNAKVFITGQGDKQEYYGYYKADKIDKMADNQKAEQGHLNSNSITTLRLERNVPNGYFNQDNTKISFSNITFDGSGNAFLSPTTDFSARVNEFSKNAFNINPYASNSFSGGCTK